jgi:hypothetical protein
VWTLTSSDNKSALRLQLRCGFRMTDSPFPEIELEIDLADSLGHSIGASDSLPFLTDPSSQARITASARETKAEPLSGQ